MPNEENQKHDNVSLWLENVIVPDGLNVRLYSSHANDVLSASNRAVVMFGCTPLGTKILFWSACMPVLFLCKSG